jgi:hypothetical protein
LTHPLGSTFGDADISCSFWPVGCVLIMIVHKTGPKLGYTACGRARDRL